MNNGGGKPSEYGDWTAMQMPKFKWDNIGFSKIHWTQENEFRLAWYESFQRNGKDWNPINTCFSFKYVENNHTENSAKVWWTSETWGYNCREQQVKDLILWLLAFWV